MSEIPESMVKMAEAIAQESYDKNASGPQFKFDVMMVAKAILAENERCAKIAEARQSYPVVKLEWDEEGGRHESPAGRGGPGADIAAAIRRR